MRRKLVLAAGFVSVAVVFTLIWFQPQKLLIDQEVDEALPGRSAAVAPDADQKGSSDSKDSAVKPRPALQTIRVGSFRPLAHPVSGRAKLIEYAAAKFMSASITSRSRTAPIYACLSPVRPPGPMQMPSAGTSST